MRSEVAPLRLHVWPDWKCNMAAGAEFSWDRQSGQLPSEQPTTTPLDCPRLYSRGEQSTIQTF